MDPDRPSIGTTIIDFDMELGGLSSSGSDLPNWLRDMVDRALSASGIRLKRHVASEEALESLIDVDLSGLEDQTCPICYEAYESPSKPASEGGDTNDFKNKRYDKQHYLHLLEQNDKLVSDLHNKGVYIQSLRHHNQFNDPALFFPTDEGCLHYSRFPVQNLSSLNSVTLEDQFPNYQDEATAKEKKFQKHTKLQSQGHIPVKMPQCDHVFGKSCVIEWLKNNVSCPLCRKEVEALKEEDPKLKKMETIAANSNFNFNDQSGMVDHLMNHSTDVFNPYRRPFNPSITPLTDSYMNQDWATPYDHSISRLESREPSLVLPRRFPFPESTIQAFPINRNSLIFPGRDNDRNNETNATTTTTNTTVNETTSNVRNSGRSNLHFVANQSDTDESDSSGSTATRVNENSTLSNLRMFNSNDSNNSRGSSPQRTGGPERSRRSGRLHPYGRPDEP